MLDAAVRMLLESPGTDVLSALKPVEIARRCDPPRTTGAFYNIWPTQAEFRRALLAHLLSLDHFRADHVTRAMLEEAVAAPDVDPDDTVRRAANTHFDSLKGHRAIRVRNALWTQADDDPEIRERLCSLYGEMAAAVVPRYLGLLRRSGRRLAPPFTIDPVAVALTALAEGLSLRWAVDPQAVPDDVGTPPAAPGPQDSRGSQDRWSLYAALAHVLLIGMTEPDDPPSGAPVPEAAEGPVGD